MALETATYISDLVSTNPTASDNISQGDDHIRLLKATVKATFPNVTGAVTATHAELNLLDGVTASTAELNILDGLTASTAELNILDGLTASTAELNYVDGVTSAIQTQLDSKVTSAGTSTLTNKTINGADNTLTVRLANDVSGTLPVANGGTGATSLTANNVLLGNGTSAVQSVAPGTSGNVLTSNGTTWSSAAISRAVLIGIGAAYNGNVTFTNIPSFSSLLAIVSVRINTGTNQRLRVALSSNNGSSYGSTINLSNSGDLSTQPYSGAVTISNTNTVGSKTITPAVLDLTGVYTTVGTESVVTGTIDAVQFSMSSTSSGIQVTLFGIP